jgi:hypothetical protein
MAASPLGEDICSINLLPHTFDNKTARPFSRNYVHPFG